MGAGRRRVQPRPRRCARFLHEVFQKRRGFGLCIAGHLVRQHVQHHISRFVSPFLSSVTSAPLMYPTVSIFGGASVTANFGATPFHFPPPTTESAGCCDWLAVETRARELPPWLEYLQRFKAEEARLLLICACCYGMLTICTGAAQGRGGAATRREEEQG